MTRALAILVVSALTVACAPHRAKPRILPIACDDSSWGMIVTVQAHDDLHSVRHRYICTDHGWIRSLEDP